MRLNWGDHTEVGFTATNLPEDSLSIEVTGEHDTVTLSSPGAFIAFRAALQDFLDGIRAGDVRTHWSDVERIVDILAMGERS